MLSTGILRNAAIFLNNLPFSIRMPPQPKMRLPSGMGGLVSYSEDSKSKYQMKPGHVVLLVGVVLLIQLVLYSTR